MKEIITISTTDGREFNLMGAEELENVDPKKECLFAFMTGEIFHGFTDGDVDEEGDFIVTRTDKEWGLGLPFYKLIGWTYLNEEKL